MKSIHKSANKASAGFALLNKRMIQKLYKNFTSNATQSSGFVISSSSKNILNLRQIYQVLN